MAYITLYHGSDHIVEKPLYGLGKPYNDYGSGFYCTEEKELAKEWASNQENNGYINEYQLDVTGLKVLDLTDTKYNILNWLSILMDNRVTRLSTQIEKRSKQFLLEHYLIDYKSFDVIIGYRADDSYFSFVRSFVSNSISLSQLEYAMHLGKLKKQVVLISKKSFKQIHFINYEIVDSSVYYPKKKKRDEDARNAFYKELEKEDINGIYIRDIIKGHKEQ